MSTFCLFCDDDNICHILLKPAEVELMYLMVMIIRAEATGSSALLYTVTRRAINLLFPV